MLDVEHYRQKRIDEHFRLLGDDDYEISFGKYYGERLSEVIRTDYSYIDWIIWVSEFDECIKEFVAEQLELRLQ